MNKIDTFISWNFTFTKPGARQEYVDAFEWILYNISEVQNYSLNLSEDRFSFSERQAFMDAWLQTPLNSGVIKNDTTLVFPTPSSNPVVSTPLPSPPALPEAPRVPVTDENGKPLEGVVPPRPAAP